MARRGQVICSLIDCTEARVKTTPHLIYYYHCNYFSIEFLVSIRYRVNYGAKAGTRVEEIHVMLYTD